MSFAALDVTFFLRNFGLKYKLNSAHRVVLNAISWRIGKNEFSFASQKKLSDECGYTENYTQKIISQLIKMGLIHVDKNTSDNRRNNYLLNKDIISPVKTAEQKCGTVIKTDDELKDKNKKIYSKNTNTNVGVIDKNTNSIEGVSQPIYINTRFNKKQRERKQKNPATKMDRKYTYHKGHDQQASDLNLDIESEYFKFVNHHLSKGTKSYNWHAEFNKWLMRGKELNIKCGTEARYEKRKPNRTTCTTDTTEFRNPSRECMEYAARRDALTDDEKNRSYESARGWLDKIRGNLVKST